MRRAAHLKAGMQQVRVKYLKRAELHCSLIETPRPLSPSERERVEPRMATDFTQDAVLHFLQSSGGSVKNSDLLLHFRFFLREHADQKRNRDLFKKYVNSVATVKQEQGVSYVILRKKFRGYVPGGGGVGSSGPPRPRAGRYTELSPEKGSTNPAGSREKSRLKPQLREETTPAPLGDSGKKTILPAAGIMLNNNNNVETNLNLKHQQQVISTSKSVKPADVQAVSHTQNPKKTKVKTPTLSEPPTQDQRPKQGQNRVGFALPPENTPAVKHHQATSEQVPVPETLRGKGDIQQPEGGLHQDPALHHNSPQSQVTPRRARCRKSYKNALSHDEYEEEEEEVPVRRGSTEGVWPLNTPLGHSDRVLSASTPCIIDQPAPPSTISSSSSLLVRESPKIYIQDVEGGTPPPPGPGRSFETGAELSGHRAGPGREPSSFPGDTMSTRRSLPLVTETLSGREAIQQPEGGLHQDPALHHISPQSQVTPRHARCRKSYKSALSHDEYEEEEEEVPVMRGSTEGVWPLNNPLGHSDRVISASSPCIIDQPANSFSSLKREAPKIYIQAVEEETLPPGGPGRSLETGAQLSGHRAGPGRGPASVPGDTMSTRRSLPLEAERYTTSLDRAELHHSIHPDQRYSQPAGVQLEVRQGSSQSQTTYPEEVRASSQGGILSPSSDASFSSDWPSSDSPRGSGWNSSYEDPQARPEIVGGINIQELLQRAQAPKPESVTHRADSKTTTPWHHSTGHLHHEQKPTACVSPLHYSTGNLHDNQQSTPYQLSWHSSTGDLHHDAEGAESSDGSTSSPPVRMRPAAAKRLSSRLRSRMCRSLGANLDELLGEEERSDGGGRGGRGANEAARLNRLHLLSSSLSLHYNLSSSSLSSCSTPPRCHSLADLAEAEGERKGGRRSLPAHESPGKQSLVPLESREHTWLVKGAAGVWPEIYSLFREDSSLLNRRDFISGFTVLHWIAKHGDHRVLNTLWYGVEKAGLTFDINARSSSGYTPLHIAAIHGNKNIMRLLVKKFSADVKLRDTAGKRPWHYLSRSAPPDIFQLLGAPARASLGEGSGPGRADRSLEKQQQQHRRRRRHHLSSASSGERPLTISGLTKVKRSSSFAAFLKHKSLRHLHGHQSDSSV